MQKEDINMIKGQKKRKNDKERKRNERKLERNGNKLFTLLNYLKTEFNVTEATSHFLIHWMSCAEERLLLT